MTSGQRFERRAKNSQSKIVGQVSHFKRAPGSEGAHGKVARFGVADLAGYTNRGCSLTGSIGDSRSVDGCGSEQEEDLRAPLAARKWSLLAASKTPIGADRFAGEMILFTRH